jgi:hypothetical protein
MVVYLVGGITIGIMIAPTVNYRNLPRKTQL